MAVKRVEPTRVPFVLEAVGQAEGSREVEVRPRVSGILEKRLYSEGASVAAGQTLFDFSRIQAMMNDVAMTMAVKQTTL